MKFDKLILTVLASGLACTMLAASLHQTEIITPPREEFRRTTVDSVEQELQTVIVDAAADKMKPLVVDAASASALSQEDAVLAEAGKYVSIQTKQGSLDDFVAAEMFRIGDGLWYVRDQSRVSLVFADPDGTLTAYHSDNQAVSVVVFLAGDPNRFLALASEEGDPSLGITCADNEFICHYHVDASETCNGYPIDSYTRCPDSTFCTGKAVEDESGCITGVRPDCYHPAEP